MNYSSSPDAAEETVSLCKENGGTAESMGFNVTDKDAVENAFKEFLDKHSKLDILVNNAGISRNSLFIRLKDEDWKDTLAVNLDGAMYCARAAAKVMMKARSGRIINMSSVVGLSGNAGQIPYSASKAGLIGLTKALARELSNRSITVNAIAPGYIETDMTAELNDELKDEHLKLIPLGRFGEPEGVAALVTYLASEQAGYITGQVIGINGGLYI